MEQYQGSSVSETIAIGKIWFYRKEVAASHTGPAADPEREIARLHAAREAALAELDVLLREATERVGKEEAAVFQGHRTLVTDPLLTDYVIDAIHTQRVNAAYAVEMAQAHFVQTLFATEDDTLRERAADVKDVAGRLLRLLGDGAEKEGPAEPSILLAEELTPSDTLRLGKGNLLGFVVREGSTVSHTAILARSMGIPALFGVDVQESWNGRTAALDGGAGTLFLDPDADTLTRMREKQKKLEARVVPDVAPDSVPTVTQSGRQIALCANVRGPEDLFAVQKAGADGIGLFRSEFLYLAASDWPTEEAQGAVYTALVQGMAGRRVVIRTLDVGADKQLPYLQLRGDERGIQVCLARPAMFRTQLAAILRAAACGPVAVLFPMIRSVSEVRSCRELLDRTAEELRTAGTAYGPVEVGVMIETPEAVEAASALANEADFFSIGTNDLTAALLGKNRLDAGLDARRGEEEPAVLSAIRTTVEAAHAAGIRVSVCGEMAADPACVGRLEALGVDGLSVTPERIPEVRAAIRGLS